MDSAVLSLWTTKQCLFHCLWSIDSVIRCFTCFTTLDSQNGILSAVENSYAYLPSHIPRDKIHFVQAVVNVDDYGNQLYSGQLEVTELDLVFYQRGKQPVRWPLRTLRRYGFDSERFTFEFGRRSPTGPGIYSFLCKQAEQLVFLLETKLQVRTHDFDHEGGRSTSHRLSSISSGGPLSPLTNNSPSIIDSFPVAPLPRPLSQNIYANEEVFSSTNQAAVVQEPPMTPVATCPREPGLETNNNHKVLVNGPEHTYVNSMLTEVESGLLSPDEPSSPGHLYMNIVPGSDCQVPEYILQPISSKFVPWESEEEPARNYCNLNLDMEVPEGPKKALNYIVLDLEPGGEQPPRSPTSSLPPDSPKNQPPGYATIDFDKTTALTHPVDPSLDDSKCSRKTRHNSNLSDLPRHSSSVSD